MNFLGFILGAIGISLSGVMAPGPITAVTVWKGNESPHAGALVALGHGAVEFPLMAAIFFGFRYINSIFNASYVKILVGLTGGLFLLFMAISMFKSARMDTDFAEKYDQSPFITGLFLTLANPYFLIWWGSLGAALILSAAKYGVWGFVAFAMAHWLCDFIWYYFLSALSFKGGEFFGRKFQQGLFTVCGVFLVLMSGKFIFDAAKELFNKA